MVGDAIITVVSASAREGQMVVRLDALPVPVMAASSEASLVLLAVMTVPAFRVLKASEELS